MESLLLKYLHLSKSEIADQGYRVQNDAYGVLDRPFLNTILTNHPEIKTVLDIGTGEGSFILPIAMKNPGVSFTCIDINEELIKRASISAKSKSVDNIDFRVATFDEEYTSDPYDLIFTRFALEHSPTPRDFVNNAFKRLKPGGIFAIVDESWLDEEDADPMWKNFKKYMRRSYETFRCNPHVIRDVTGWLEQAGFSDIQLSNAIYSPSSVGSESFKALILSIPVLINKFLDVEVWPKDFLEDLELWIDEVNKTASTNPTITFGHVTAKK